MRIAPKSAEDRVKFRLGGYGIKFENAVKDPRSSAAGEAWRYDDNGKLYALVFRGTAFKAEWYYRFKDNAARDCRINMFFKSIEEWSARMAERKAERMAAPRGMDVGDILRSSWGYDQTNIDYYEVTKLIGKRKVEIRAIGGESREDLGWMRGTCVPVPGSFKGEPMVKVAVNGSVRIASYASATKIKPLAEMAGKKLYPTDNWTAYA